MSTENAPQPPPAEAPAEGVPQEGDILAGKYRIEKVLGQGGMGVVVAAQHTTLRQKVAIKLLLPEAAKREDSSERFQREARAAFAIQSEHVARVMDVGTLENGAPYMVMEYLTGLDLGEVLAQRGRLPLAEAVDYILQACEAVAEAHSIGIIHRDLKPSNLFLTQRAGGAPLVKVLDFGLSKVTRPDTLDASLTAANVVMGSPSYMSPEQIRSLKGLDARTDIWALGVILYQILCGVRPFDASSLGALFFTIGADPPAPLRSHRADIPAELEAAVLKCLEKDQNARTQTVAELARLLAPFGTDDARISVERIHRVLNDGTPMPVKRPSMGSLPSAIPSRRPGEDTLDEAPTLARPMLYDAPRVDELSANRRAGPTPVPMAPGAPLAPYPGAPAVLFAPAVNGPLPENKVQSGSMAALARDGVAPSVPPPARAAAARGRAGVMVAVVGAAVLSLVGVAFVALRGGGGDMATAAAIPATVAAATPSAAVTAEVTAAPATAAPSAVPSATASAAAPADTAAPTASASASVKPGKGPLPRVPRAGGATKKDLLDKWSN